MVSEFISCLVQWLRNAVVHFPPGATYSYEEEMDPLKSMIAMLPELCHDEYAKGVHFMRVKNYESAIEPLKMAAFAAVARKNQGSM